MVNSKEEEDHRRDRMITEGTKSSQKGQDDYWHSKEKLCGRSRARNVFQITSCYWGKKKKAPHITE